MASMPSLVHQSCRLFSYQRESRSLTRPFANHGDLVVLCIRYSYAFGLSFIYLFFSFTRLPLSDLLLGI